MTPRINGEVTSMHESAVRALREHFARCEEFRANQLRRFLVDDVELLTLLSR